MSPPTRKSGHPLTDIPDACRRFEEAWERGPAPNLGDCLAGTEGQARIDLLRALLPIDLRQRRRRGQQPAPMDYPELKWHELAAVQEIFEVTELAPVTPLRPDERTTVVQGATPAEEMPALVQLPQLPGYRILELLGEGGMGAVYKAQQLHPPRLVAIKTLLRFCSRGDDLQRFRRETEALARIQHENVVRIYEVGEVQGRPFFSMELVNGGSLRDYLSRGRPLPPEQAAAIVEQMARAAHAAHSAGVVHRDIKPGNVLVHFPALGSGALPDCLVEPYVLKLTDFGLARQQSDTFQTRTGDVLGTPGYMAPEQARGLIKEVGHPADIYALGAVLYELLTGRPPFEGKTPANTLLAVVSEEPATPRSLNRAIPRDLETICLKCLEKNPKNRYPNARVLADRLHAFRAGEPIPDRPRPWYSRLGRRARRRPVLTALLVLLLLLPSAALLSWHLLNPERPRQLLLQSLDQGKPYIFTGHDPLPGPFRKILGEAALRNGNGHFTIQALKEALLELTDDSRHEHYRFSAWMRHDDGLGNSRIGLFFGREELMDANGVHHGRFYSLTFSERGALAQIKKSKDRIFARLGLHTHLYDVPRPEQPFVGECPVALRLFEPQTRPGTAAPWRKLIVTVSPQGVSLSWQRQGGPEELIARMVPGRTLEEYQRDQLLVWSTSPGYAAGQQARLGQMQVPYRPRGGLGLIVREGEAAFRDIVLEPLPRQ